MAGTPKIPKKQPKNQKKLDKVMVKSATDSHSSHAHQLPASTKRPLEPRQSSPPAIIKRRKRQSTTSDRPIHDDQDLDPAWAQSCELGGSQPELHSHDDDVTMTAASFDSEEDVIAAFLDDTFPEIEDVLEDDDCSLDEGSANEPRGDFEDVVTVTEVASSFGDEPKLNGSS